MPNLICPICQSETFTAKYIKSCDFLLILNCSKCKWPASISANRNEYSFCTGEDAEDETLP